MTTSQQIDRQLWNRLDQVPEIGVHPQAECLKRIVAGQTSMTSKGFPYISEESFQTFVCRVPHLFSNGLAILKWVDGVLHHVRGWEDLEPCSRDSALRALKVIQNMVYTASITAPSDLWLVRQVLSTHKSLAIVGWLKSGNGLSPEAFAKEHQFNERQLKIDLHFLYSRGYLRLEDGTFFLSEDEAVRQLFAHLTILPKRDRGDMTKLWMRWFAGEEKDPEGGSLRDRLEAWLSFEAKKTRPQTSWIAGQWEVELGYRLLPVVLAMRARGLTLKLERQAVFSEIVPRSFPSLMDLLSRTGLVHDDRVTLLGARVFERGPGPFGIVGAYTSYLEHLDEILRGKVGHSWVSRGENVAASQDANRKSFASANKALDDFCTRFQFDYDVFIEHAVGKGEATRQRFERDRDERLRYFGADLEDAAIDEAIKEQERGVLPKNMKFIRSADIGEPSKITEALKAEGLDGKSAVMVVGNGFHEIRDQSDTKMIQVLNGYREAGILLIFTEETGLTDSDLLNTAWNTYHAGFRHVHEMSGQGLRPSWRNEKGEGMMSWSECAEKADYRVLHRYTATTRTIYPYKKGRRKNPSISVTYFCVPEALCRSLNISLEDCGRA
ncbi:hypothetical protein SCOR_24025 [Sulfidibacter corallicola]|uniref:Uncharacterized protein n=1 Tax=Sulfidibacter corallicola TaxID=2818388 RepID=A0A8A4TU10_SULCO|nr:hypothetical protein [Sulfidibacter corallicola]QTD52522.1 hypothetical protein J3U87_08620 [Sulfidibacter corallicola]